ncbi:MAG: ABC transporter substrate-binding protein [Micromonosporaceae bacterium]
MKRLTSCLVGSITLALVLTACGSSGDPEADAGPARITFSSHVKGMDLVVKAFNSVHPDIKVTFEQTPSPNEGGNAKLTNALKAGNAPDLVTVEYQDLPSFVSQGGVQPVDTLAGDVLKGVPENITSAVRFAGKTWAIPYDAAPLVFYYRADVFQQLGITPPETWDEFRTAAKTIAAKQPGTSIASFFPNEAKLFAALAWQNGAHWFRTEGDTWKVSLTDPQTAEVADYWQGLINDDLVKVEQAFSEEWANSLGTGKVVGVIGASWGAGGLVTRTESSAGKWAVAQLPHWGTPASALYGGSTFAVTKNSKQAKAAAALATWLVSSPDALKARGDVGSTYPAATNLVAIAKQNYPTAHFGDQDIYAEFDTAAGSVVTGWTWGPTLSTLTTLGDGFGSLSSGGTIDAALEKAETSTVTEMKGAGLNVG